MGKSDPFIVSDYAASQNCPRCGGKMSPAIYYISNAKILSSKSDWNLNYTTTTTNMQYSNIQKMTGGICKECYLKESKDDKILSVILTIICAAVVLASIVLFLISAISSWEYGLIGAIGGIGLFLSVPTFFKLLPYSIGAKNRHETLQSGSPNDLATILSTAVVTLGHFPKQNNEVFLDITDYKKVTHQDILLY